MAGNGRACRVTFLEAPCEIMNSRSASSCSPRRITPCSTREIFKYWAQTASAREGYPLPKRVVCACSIVL